MLWDFQRILNVQLSNLNDEVSFLFKLYKNIGPKTSKIINEATHCPNRGMHEISTSVNNMTIW